MATKKQITEFFNKIGALAVQVAKERGYGNAQVWTCMAQAGCESAYGTSGIMANAHAYFGIKATKSWVNAGKYGGLVYNAGTKECYDGKSYTNITACFRAYNSDIDSIRDYFDLMETGRYKASLTKTTVKDCITDIKNGGYATAPTYIDTICKIYESNKALIESFRVDATPAEKPAEEPKQPEKQPEPVKADKVMVTTEKRLNVRKNPSTDSSFVHDALPYGTIVELSKRSKGLSGNRITNWGYSEKYKGWICLDYTKNC